MKDDPVIWLTAHIIVGVHLREEAWSLRTKEEADAWENRQLRWWEELHEGIKCRSLRDAARVEVVDRVRLVELLVGHPYYDEIIPATMVWTSTGAGRPGNNPLSRHAACIERAQEIEREWRELLPAIPKLAKPSIPYDEFAGWHAERAAAAQPDDRSSREEDRKVAVRHFGCSIPEDWVDAARKELPKDHPYFTRGRRPAR